MNTLFNINDILNHQISGFHQYVFEPAVHLNYVSKNLCDMLGVQEDELLNEKTDLYAGFVYPEDHKKYTDFINSVSKN